MFAEEHEFDIFTCAYIVDMMALLFVYHFYLLCHICGRIIIDSWGGKLVDIGAARQTKINILLTQLWLFLYSLHTIHIFLLFWFGLVE